MTDNNLVARFQSTVAPYGTVTQEIKQVHPKNINTDFYHNVFKFVPVEEYPNSQLATITGISDLQQGFSKISDKAYNKGYLVNPVYLTNIVNPNSSKAVLSKDGVVETKITTPVPYITSYQETGSKFIGLAYISRDDVLTYFNIEKRVSSQRKEWLFDYYCGYLDSVKKGNFYEYSVYFNKTLLFTKPDIFTSSLVEIDRILDGDLVTELGSYLKGLSVKDYESVAELFDQTAKTVYLRLPEFFFYN